MRVSLPLYIFPLALGVAWLATGCPSRADMAPVPAACTKFGEQCLLEPGKLGTCVQRSECEAGQSCLVCQSQH